jgi:hypothetical protein
MISFGNLFAHVQNETDHATPAFIKSLENLATRFRWLSLQTELAGGSRFTARVHGPA